MVRDEVHPLDALLAKEHFSSTEDSDLGAHVPECITNALQKDKAPLPEVCTSYIHLKNAESVAVQLPNVFPV